MKSSSDSNFVTLNGMVFDYPLSENLRKWDFKVYKEAKTTFKEVWIDRYLKDGNAYVRWSYCLKITNRGKCFLDDKVLSGEDVEKVKAIFESLKEVIK